MHPEFWIAVAVAVIAVVSVHLWHVKHPRVVQVEKHVTVHPPLHPDHIYCDFCGCHVARYKRTANGVMCANCEAEGRG